MFGFIKNLFGTAPKAETKAEVPYKVETPVAEVAPAPVVETPAPVVEAPKAPAKAKTPAKPKTSPASKKPRAPRKPKK
jgi:hypothetical protein